MPFCFIKYFMHLSQSEEGKYEMENNAKRKRKLNGLTKPNDSGIADFARIDGKKINQLMRDAASDNTAFEK